MRRGVVQVVFLLAAGCGSSEVGSDEDARVAYEGLDGSIDKAITLGLQGFNLASNANIPPQTTQGDKAGTITVTGKVDHGASDNKTMNLNEELAAYSDDETLTYDTHGSLPTLSMKLANIPTGTLSGTLDGDVEMTGDLEGEVTFSLSFSGDLQPMASDPNKVERKPGTTHITGSVTSGDGHYEVDLTR